MEKADTDFIRQVLSVAETGKPEWNPSAVYVYSDDNRFTPAHKQVTLSIGFTEGGGNLKKVLQRYVDKGGKTSFGTYIPTLGTGPTRANDSTFIALLKAAGTESVMVEAQKECFEEMYLGPAFKWAEQYAFTLPLSFLVIADSYLHSGSMLGFLMAKFPEKKPSAGGNEKKWITDYLAARHSWLKNHSNKILNGTVYRADCYMREASKDNWDLTGPGLVMNGTPIKRTA